MSCIFGAICVLFCGRFCFPSSFSSLSSFIPILLEKVRPRLPPPLFPCLVFFFFGTELVGSGDRFGDYLCVDCANLPRAIGRNKFTSTKFTKPTTKISKSFSGRSVATFGDICSLQQYQQQLSPSAKRSPYHTRHWSAGNERRRTRERKELISTESTISGQSLSLSSFRCPLSLPPHRSLPLPPLRSPSQNLFVLRKSHVFLSFGILFTPRPRWAIRQIASAFAVATLSCDDERQREMNREGRNCEKLLLAGCMHLVHG